MGASPSGGPGTMSVNLKVLVDSSVANGTNLVIGGNVAATELPAGVTANNSPAVLVTNPNAMGYTTPLFDIGKMGIGYGSAGWNDPYISNQVIPDSTGLIPGRLVPYVVYIRALKGAPGF
jgi:hypothetical protein